MSENPLDAFIQAARASAERLRQATVAQQQQAIQCETEVEEEDEDTLFDKTARLDRAIVNHVARKVQQSQGHA